MKRFAFAVAVLGFGFAVPASAEEPLPPPPLLEAAPLDSPEPEPEAAPEGAVDVSARPDAKGPGLRVGRMGIGALSGAVAGAALGFGAGYGVLALMCGGTSCSDWGPVLVAVFVGGAGLVFGIPLGTLVAGRVMGSQGSFGWAFLGTLAGGALGYVTGYVLGSMAGPQSMTVVTLFAMALLAPLGAAAGLEFSSWRNEPRRRSSAGAISLAPAFAVSPQGGYAGVSARF